ncbi:MAG: hypothetical protein DRP99_05515 [Candidatus Latescibacterota bacterium]|nr:MAG: hypothetical protein DRP99_05515 [Candidatus Latescibacterota bacterium]
MAQGKEGGGIRIGRGMRLEFFDANARIGTVGYPQHVRGPSRPGGGTRGPGDQGKDNCCPARRGRGLHTLRPYLLGSLGEEWLILRQYFKLYPTCRWTHPAVEGVDALRRKYGFTHRDVERIDVETFEEAAGLTKFPPEHSDGAQYCMQWAVAAMLVDGTLGVEQVSLGRLSDPEVIELGRRVRVHVAEDIQERFPEECLARVTVTLRDGRSFSTGTLGARGDYDNPLSDDELEEKFRELVAGSLGEEACEELREVVDTLDVRPAEDLVSVLRRRLLP